MTHTAKHTPGPWYRNIPPANKYTTVWSGRNKHVAYIKQMPDDVEAEANINLIAAAPAMYEALQSILDSENSTLGDGGSILGDDYRSLLQAALAQAEGRQP